MNNGTSTTIDAAGRLVIPKAVREQAGLREGMSLDVRCRDGVIEIEPRPLDVKRVRRGRLLVAMPRQGQVPALTGQVVERTRSSLRRERAD